MTPAEIRAARQALGMTGLAFADAVGHSQRSVWRWEAGAAPIPGSVAKLVARMLVDVGSPTAARLVEYALSAAAD